MDIMNKEYTWRTFKKDLPTLVKRNKRKVLDNYWNMSSIIYYILESLYNFDPYFTDEDKKSKSQRDLYFMLRRFLEANSKELKRIIYQMIPQLSKFVTFQPQDPSHPVASTYAIKFVKSLYFDFKKLLRDKELIKKIYASANDFDNFKLRQILESYIRQIINTKLPNLTEIEYEVLIEYAMELYQPLIKANVRKNINNVLESDKKEIFNIIDEYIAKNIYQLFSSANLLKDPSNSYLQSWIAPTGELEDNFELNILQSILKDNRKQIQKLISNDVNYNDVISTYLLLYGNKWTKKIYNLISAKNLKLKTERGKNLLELHDEIGDETSIDYDVTADNVRNRPLIIVHDDNTNKDFVMFGPRGVSHGFYISSNKLFADAAQQNIKIDEYKMGYGYLLGKIAFVDEKPDENQFGYSNDEIVNILKSDPRIEKVYQTGGHPHKPGNKIKRLAKLVFKITFN